MRIEMSFVGLDAADHAVAALEKEFAADRPAVSQHRDETAGLMQIEFAPPSGVLQKEVLSQLQLRAERVSGVVITAFGPTPYVSVSRIAKRIGLDVQAVDEMVQGSDGHPPFPAPLNPNDGEPMWRWPEVRDWLQATATPVQLDIADGGQDRAERLIAEHNERLRQIRAAQIFRTRIRKEIDDEDSPR